MSTKTLTLRTPVKDHKPPGVVSVEVDGSLQPSVQTRVYLRSVPRSNGRPGCPGVTYKNKYKVEVRRSSRSRGLTDTSERAETNEHPMSPSLPPNGLYGSRSRPSVPPPSFTSSSVVPGTS